MKMKMKKFCMLGVLVTVMLEHMKVQLSPQIRKCDGFACFFCGCNCKTSKICHQRTRFFTIEAG